MFFNYFMFFLCAAIAGMYTALGIHYGGALFYITAGVWAIGALVWNQNIEDLQKIKVKNEGSL